jgi:hypothetical protein
VEQRHISIDRLAQTSSVAVQVLSGFVVACIRLQDPNLELKVLWLDTESAETALEVHGSRLPKGGGAKVIRCA